MSGNSEAPVAGTRTLPVAQVLAIAEQHRLAGRLAAAEQLCRDVLRALPRNAEALHLLGLVAHQAGNTQAAIDLIRQAIAADGSVALFHCNLGEMSRLVGRIDDAVAAGRRALELQPSYPQALNNLGIAYLDRGDHDSAIKCLEQALRLAPNVSEAHSNLGNVWRAQGKLDEAIAAYRRAIAVKPANAEAHNNLGTVFRDRKKPEQAEAAFREALALKPRDSMILDNLALALIDQERFDEARSALAESLAIRPNNHKPHAYLASMLLEQGELAEARASAARALALDGEDADSLNVMGKILFEENHAEQALDYFRRALARKSDLADAWNNLGNALNALGRIDEAVDAYLRALEIKPDLTSVYMNLADAKTFSRDDPHLAAMEALAGDTAALKPIEQAQLHFGLAKAYADLGKHPGAFRHLSEGNALKRREVAYDEGRFFAFFDRITEVFTPALMRENQALGDPSTLPVFILGMPRSGSTLVEQILASHPKVFAAGEIKDFDAVLQSVRLDEGGVAPYPDFVPAFKERHLRQFATQYAARLRSYSPDAERITNKMPANFFYIGLIRLTLPNARIIHTRRDPVDTCLSCFSRLFSGEQDFTYDLGELGRYYRRYAGLMAHWRRLLPPGAMLEVDYESLVADIEAGAREIVQYCGLDWDPACREFYKTRRPIRTASASQVRKPAYRTSVGRSGPYREFLTPLLQALSSDG